jgi:hypothetical protein
MNRTGWASQVIDLVNFQENGIDNVVPDKLEAGMIQQVLDISLMAGEVVIQANHLLSFPNKLPAEVRT